MSTDDLQIFEISPEDFDEGLLSQRARRIGSQEFKAEVRRFFERNLEAFAGWYQISVEDDKIRVSWKTSPSKPDAFDEIIKMLQQGEYQEGIQLLRFLLPSRENDASVHYNLGMALSDIGRLTEAQEHLQRAIQISPTFTNAKVALGVALFRQHKPEEAIIVLQEAVEEEPDNPYAVRNLAACLLSLEKDLPLAETYLRRAIETLPGDQQSWIGLAQALEAQGRMAEADEAYRRTIELNPYGEIAEIGRTARSKIAERSFRDEEVGGLRPDAVTYCLSALQAYATMTREQVQRCAFEIAALGTKGINVNDPSREYTLKAMAGTFSGLQLICFEFVGFKQIAPQMDIGFDVSKEYEAALQLFMKR